MTFTALTAVGVGARVTGIIWNKLVTAIQELQTLATTTITTQTKTGIVQAVAADTALGSWASSGGYTISGSGLAVPNAGVYLVTLRASRTSGAWSTRAYLSCTVGSAVYRTSIDAGVGETEAVLSFATDSVAAATVIQPRYYTGTAATTTFVLTIVQLPVG